MSYRKYPLFFLLTLSFAQSAEATLRGTGNFNSILEESCQNFSTTRMATAPKVDNVKAFDFKKYIPNMKYNGAASKGKEKEQEKENIENREADFRKVLGNWRQGLNSSQEQSGSPKVLAYLKENKRNIAINRVLMDSGFILSVSGNTALRLSDSYVYTIISNPGEDKKPAPVKTEIDAGSMWFDTKKEAFEPATQRVEILGKKSKAEVFFRNLFKPAIEANRREMLGKWSQGFYHQK